MKRLLTLFSALILTLLLVGCATEQYYANAVNSWQGAPQEAVYHVWGYPNRTNKLPNGHQVLVYRSVMKGRDPIYSTPGSTSVVTNPNGRTRVTTTESTLSGGGTYDYECRTWFELNRKGRVVNTSFRGNNCVATKQFMMMHLYNGIG